MVRAATSLFLAVTKRARAALLEEGVDPAKIAVVPAAVDCDRFHPAVPTTDFRTRWEVPASVPLIVYVGRLIQEKGLVELIRAFTLSSRPQAHLVFVGTGNQGPRLTTAAAALGVSDRVHIVPFVSYGEMPDVFRSADLVVAPSLPTPYWEEQFGMVLVEAMASGRALVTTASGAIPEVVGDGAVLVPPYDIEALTGVMDRLLTDPEERSTLGLEGPPKSERSLRHRAGRARIAACYRRVMGE